MDIYSTVPMSYAQAALGGDIKINTVDGDIIYTVKPGTQTDTKVRFKGKGVPSLRNKNVRGDHYVTLVVQVPTKLNDAAKQALKEFDMETGNSLGRSEEKKTEKAEKGKKKGFTLKTLTEAEDIVISTLADAGVEGVEIEDKVPLSESDKQQMFVDILPDAPEDDGIAYLSFYLEEDADKEAILARVNEGLEELRSFMDIGEGTIEEGQTEDKDWINNWKQYFHQFYVDDILIIPSWEEVQPEDADKMIIHIDPGTAFGTGMHETTQLCMRQLKKYVTPETELLDVGTGSGILSIVALKLGAKHAVGTDLDPCAITAAKENLEANEIPNGSMDVMIGNIIDDKAVQDAVGYEKYDIVTANILADVLVPLTPVIIHQMKKGGIYITSGIIDEKEETVVEAVKAAGLEVLEVTHQNDWVSVTARKN